MDVFYFKAFIQSEASDHCAALKILDGALGVTLENSDFLKLKAEVLLRAGDLQTTVFAYRSSWRPTIMTRTHRTLDQTRSASSNLRGALKELESTVSLGADDAEVHAAKGKVYEKMSATNRASEYYSATVSKDPIRLNLAEKLARMMHSRREFVVANGILDHILSGDPHYMSAILLKAEITGSWKDDKTLMATYEYFTKYFNPGPESTFRMTCILEEDGYQAEARSLVVGKPQRETAVDPVKRNVKKALRRTYFTGAPPTDPDMLDTLNFDKTAVEVATYR